ncbi:MAG: TadE family type IV pilus minor pilin [Actinocrinis sp.]
MPAPAGEQGFVTAETAMVLPSLVGLGLALVLVVTAAAAHLRCADAAWEAARGIARGEPPGYAAQAIGRLGPPGASASVSTGRGSVSVRVSASITLGGALLPAVHLDGHAQIACEPGTPCADDGISFGPARGVH